jgi:putative peptidoglycan binding protein
MDYRRNATNCGWTALNEQTCGKTKGTEIMKTKLLGVALLASATTITQANPAVVRSGGGGFHGGAVAHAPAAVHAPARPGGFSSFRSMPQHSFGARNIYSGPRYSAFGTRSAGPRAFRPASVYPRGTTITRSGPYTAATINQAPQANRFPRFANRTNPAGTSVWNQRNIGPNQFRNGNNFRNASNFRNANNLRNPNQFRNGNNVRNGNNRLRGDWNKHVFAHRAGDWHRDWDHHSDHWWNGHRCSFINGTWVIFNIGFDPWWPYSWYPDDYYYDYGFPNDGYGSSTYGYNYPYSYNNDPSYYDSGDYQDQMYYDQNGYPDQSQGYYDSSVYQTEAYYDSNGYSDQSQSNYSIVSAAQDRLVREGYYNGESNGVLGAETREALKSYQSNHGLRVTGSLDSDTVATMGLR